MRKRSGAVAAAAKKSAAKLNAMRSPSSPPPLLSSSIEKKKKNNNNNSNGDDDDAFGFRVSSFFYNSGSKKITATATTAAKSPTVTPVVVTVSDLREMASSQTEVLKRQMEHCHGEVIKEIDASCSRLSKRLKLQTQGCMQLIEEAEKDYKKMTDRITESTESMKSEYEEFIKEVQASAAHVSKVTILELSDRVEKSIDALRKNYRIPAAQK